MWMLTTLLAASLVAHGTLASYMDFLQGDWVTYDYLFKPMCCHYYQSCLQQEIYKWAPCPSLPQDISTICRKIFSRDKACHGQAVTARRPAAFDRSEVRKEKACLMAMKTGPCKMALTRYAFNKTSDKCQSFLYGGCFGNSNNFNTLDECNRKCTADLTHNTVANSADIQKQEVKESRCSQPLVTGPCKMFTNRFGFDTKIGQCRSFLYGGCRGNDNRFMMMQDCELSCAAAKDNAV